MDVLAAMTTFVRVVDANSLSGGARATGLSLPAVSRQIRALEDDLGAALLLRTTRRMALTDHGRLVYDTAVRLVREIEETRARVRTTRDVRGTLVVSAPISIALSLVVPKIPAFTRAHPRAAIDLRLEDRLVDFVRDGVDVAVRGGVAPPDSTAYVAQPLLRFRRTLVASPSYLRRRGRPRRPEQLARHACLVQVADTGPIATWRLERDRDRHDVTIAGPVRSTAPTVLRDLARQGVGIALVADWLVEADLEGGSLERVLPGWSSPEITAWAVHRIELRGSPLVAAFLGALRDR